MRATTPLVLAVAFIAASVFDHASAAKLRETCSSNSDCAGIEFANCTDKKCVCAAGYFPSYNGTFCHHKSEVYEAPCFDMAECQAILGLKAGCRKKLLSNDTTERCLCLLDNHYNPQTYTCHKTLRLNDRCAGDVEGQCYLETNGDDQHVVCGSNGTCVCEAGYVPDFDILKCNSAPRLEWLSLSCMLGLLVVALVS